MQFIVQSKRHDGENWIDLPETICSGRERAKDYAWKFARYTEVQTKARVCERKADECDEVCGFERDADGHFSER